MIGMCGCLKIFTEWILRVFEDNPEVKDLLAKSDAWLQRMAENTKKWEQIDSVKSNYFLHYLKCPRCRIQGDCSTGKSLQEIWIATSTKLLDSK